MQYIIDRLKERSTYAGLAALAAAFNWKLDPDLWAAASAAIIALVAFWEILRKENSK